MLEYEDILDSGQALGEKNETDVWGRAQELKRGGGN